MSGPSGAPRLTLRQVREAVRLLRAASNPTRMEILLLLGSGEKDSPSLAAVLPCPSSLPAHYKALEDMGLIRGRRAAGRRILFRLTWAGEALVELFCSTCERVVPSIVGEMVGHPGGEAE